MLRRRFIRLLSQGIIGSALLPELALANHTVDKRRLQFVFAQLKYRGGDWNPHPLSVTPLMEELMARTSVEAGRCSLSAVNPARSANSTVTSFRSPASESSLLITRSTSGCGDGAT